MALMHGISYALLAGPIAGLFFGLMMYFFINSKLVKQQTALSDVASGDIIYSGGANHFKNAEAVGGKLYLLKDHLEFKSHGFNIQNHSFIIYSKEIEKIIFYNTLGFVPNGLKLVLKDGEEEKFVVSNRSIWKNAIDEQILKTG